MLQIGESESKQKEEKQELNKPLKENSIGDFMSEFYYYKGLYKVKVVTQSEGYWIVEALEDFEDCEDGERVTIKVGERRIVASTDLHKNKTLPPPIPEHVYERRLEKKVRQIVAENKNEKENQQ